MLLAHVRRMTFMHAEWGWSCALNHGCRTGNQGSMTLGEVPLHPLLCFLATSEPHWLGWFPTSFFLQPWYRGALTSSITSTAMLLHGAFHVHGACSAALSSQWFCFINEELLYYYEPLSRPRQGTWDELKIPKIKHVLDRQTLQQRHLELWCMN